MNDTFLDQDLSAFAIVRPADARHGEDFLANELQYAVWKNRGLKLPIRDTSAGPDAYEFLIGGEAPEGTYVFHSEGNKICFCANDMFGYMDAATMLCVRYFGNVFHGGMPREWHKELQVYQDVHKQKHAALRLIFHNVWGMDAPHNGGRSRYAAAYHLAYGADVVSLNEYGGTFTGKGDYEKIMTESGYRKVPVAPEKLYRNCYFMPVWYRADRLELLEADYTDYRMHDGSKGVTLAVFRQKDGEGRRFAVACTHLAAAWDCPQSEKIYRQLKNQQFLFGAIGKALEKWGGMPVFVGGDTNCQVYTETCLEFFRNGYADAFDLAERKNDCCSCHGYPTYCEELGFYVTGTQTNVGGYRSGIDHVFVRGADRVRVALYHVNQESVVPVISDHCPQMVDVDLL